MLQCCTDLEEKQMGNCFFNFVTLARRTLLKKFIRNCFGCQPKEKFYEVDKMF